jgi:glycolate oxidase subunit GlcD
MPRRLPSSFRRRLRRLFPDDRLVTDPALLRAYECDALTHFRSPPLAVAFPETTGEVQETVRAAVAAGVPLTARGAGTCLSGGAIAADGGILLETSRMRRILEIDAENRRARVQPGVVNARLSRAAAPFGLLYAPDPSSQTVSTIGGNVAENAGGPHCLAQGVTSQHVLAVEIVTGTGERVTLGSPLEETEELDLRGLFIGSEGTLGIATEITCRLVPRPESVETLLASYGSLPDACRAVARVIAAGIVPSALEVLDERTIRAVEGEKGEAGYPLDAAAVLLVEVDGPEARVASEARAVEEHLAKERPLRVERAVDDAHRARLWKGRKGAFGAMGRQAPDLYLQDAVVPRSRLPEVIEAISAICTRHEVTVANVFHAGDGNLHPILCYDSRHPGELERVLAASAEIVRVCLEAGGTLSGEHGIGIEKRDHMPELLGAQELRAMGHVRSAFDPTGLMNPGKLLPTPGACAELRAAGRGAR